MHVRARKIVAKIFSPRKTALRRVDRRRYCVSYVATESAFTYFRLTWRVCAALRRHKISQRRSFFNGVAARVANFSYPGSLSRDGDRPRNLLRAEITGRSYIYMCMCPVCTCPDVIYILIRSVQYRGSDKNLGNPTARRIFSFLFFFTTSPEWPRSSAARS